MFLEKFSRNATKKTNCKFSDTYKNIHQKINIITKLAEDLVKYEMQKLTVGHQ